LSTFKFDKNFDLGGKVALITGAGKGIGKAIALLYARKGADVILVGKSTNIEQVEHEIFESDNESENKCLSLLYDITKTENISKIIRASINKFGKIDILVNNAGIVLLDDSVNMPKEEWDKILEVNLTAPFLLSQAVGKEMINRKYGKIINISSLAGVLGYDKRAAYCASKAGLIGLTKALAFEWARYNITVNAISPTVTLTEMAEKAWSGKEGVKMRKKIPLGRFIYPEEVAAVAAFLASDASDMITGANIIIDGGYSIN
jgi:NAD(P)-dependent dehydrogenase (short-subunit alcohol dehydrogenase family)